ncbi:MAG: phospholipase D-like domain-containing protein [Spirochaetota bacterium]|nr:phospholipase D-like domain-containing protein [Spirochaetota bacterium]
MTINTFINKPDSEPSFLLNKLIDMIEDIPKGETLHIAFYYLRNIRMCNALIQAKDRGVKIKILMSGNTYYKTGNVDSIKFLRNNGFNENVFRLRHTPNIMKRRMHLKLFLASKCGSRKYISLFGTYNPSGNDENEKDVFDVIGDQDNGYNVMMEIEEDKAIYDYLLKYFITLFEKPEGRFMYPSKSFRDISFYPSPSKNNRFLSYIKDLEQNVENIKNLRIRIAVSHISERVTVKTLCKLAVMGHDIEIIGHDTERRFPKKVEKRLKKHRVMVIRYIHPEGFPMHCKFILSEYNDINGKSYYDLFLGSMNLTNKSYYRNDELLALFSNHTIFEDFSKLYEELRANTLKYLDKTTV